MAQYVRRKKKGGQTLVEQGKVNINMILIIHNKMNHVETIKRDYNFGKIEHR